MGRSFCGCPFICRCNQRSETWCRWASGVFTHSFLKLQPNLLKVSRLTHYKGDCFGKFEWDWFATVVLCKWRMEAVEGTLYWIGSKWLWPIGIVEQGFRVKQVRHVFLQACAGTHKWAPSFVLFSVWLLLCVSFPFVCTDTCTTQRQEYANQSWHVYSAYHLSDASEYFTRHLI